MLVLWSVKLDPGKYKIFVNDGPFGSTHFLYVYHKKGKVYYRMDHGSPQLAEGDTLFPVTNV